LKKVLITLTMIIISLVAGGLNLKNSTNAATIHIHDPLLRQAWDQLNSFTEPIQLPDRTIISGHDLAQYILQNHIEINWDENNVCKGSSCSVRYYDAEKSIFTHRGQPIYIRVSLKAESPDRIQLLVQTMAHEIFHYIEPFSQDGDSLYEEYLAYNISARIAYTKGMDDACSNPLLPACLKSWFEAHNLMYGYTQFPVYPSSLASKIDTSGENCATEVETTIEEPKLVVPTQAPSTTNPACTINAIGLVDCQH
jgi:hypothetical protein